MHRPIIFLVFSTVSGALAQMPSLPSAPPLPHTALPTIRDVPAPPAWWMPWAVGLLIALLIGIIVWLLLRPKTVSIIPPRQPVSSALRALGDLRSRLSTIPPAEMSHRVSLVLRRYLSERYAVPATVRTTGELFTDLRDLDPGKPVPRAPGAWKERFAPVARLCDDISFMPAPRTVEESGDLIDLAIQRVEEERL